MKTAQVNALQHRKIRVATLPIINRCMQQIELRKLVADALRSPRYAAAIEVLIKNVLLQPAALYRVAAWSAQFDSDCMGAEPPKDDLLGRALDRLFKCDRATLQTKVTMATVRSYDIDVSQIHNDTTSVKFYGAYAIQRCKGVQLKRGHSKDHRPDLKQLLYNLSVTRDGAVPVHFKAYDGHRTDDTMHIENWTTLRGLLRRADFLYVADAKLCTSKNMMHIDREHGRFVTIVPRTRLETKTFADECYESTVRWEPLTRRPSTRAKDLYDVFYLAAGRYQLEEGFRLYWYRSSDKRKRDAASRKERVERVLQKLTTLNQTKSRGRRTQRSLLKQANRILERHNAEAWFDVTVTHRTEEVFTKTSPGKPNESSTYRRREKRIPELVIKKNHEQLARSRAIDGVFPLTTNTALSAKEVLTAYKYQPHIEKRFSGIKSDLEAAPAFLKRNDRTEGLMFVVYLADLLAALIQRELRSAMRRHGIDVLHTLPEERPSKTPTWEQVQRLFANHCRYQLLQDGRPLRTFADELTEPQKQVLRLLSVNKRCFR